MILLLLLLPVLLGAARMTVEWLWFSQFDLQLVLQSRWGFYLASAAASLVPVVVVHRWRLNLLDGTTSRERSGTPFQGARYSVVLLLTLIGVLMSTALIGCLTLLAIVDPFSLRHWYQSLAVLKPSLTLLLPPLLLITGLALSRRRWIATWACVGSCCLVFISARAWGLWSLALAIPDSGFTDGLLGADASFALARYAALRLAIELLILLWVFQLSLALWTWSTQSPALSDWKIPGFRLSQLKQLRRWAAAGLFLCAAWIWLSRHALLWSPVGGLAGAGWLQHHLTLPLRTGLSLLLVVAAVVVLIPNWSVRTRQALKTISALLALTLVAEVSLSPLLSWLWLRPQELSLQTPYIQKTIQSTRHAFQLDQIVKRSQVPTLVLTESDVARGRSTLDNVRLWDTQPLLQTNSQLQELRSYYHFSGAAVDRYPLLDDQDTSQQVILAPRELDQTELPRRSRTWLNRHFVFTHGYGFTLSPVNTFSDEGLPDYFISDLGSATNINGNAALGISREVVRREVPVDDGGLYFGTLEAPYVIAPTRVGEIDYPDGDENAYTSYRGRGGIPIGELWQRCLAMVYLFEPRLLFSPSITPDTHLLLRREVRERVHAIAPFLDLRGDPYLVSVPQGEPVPGFEQDQHQYWIVEGYTSSYTFPYSSVVGDGNGERYLRNSVKAVVDAYNGTVHLYVSEPEDPLIQGWARVFPNLFKSLASMPTQLRDHLRVPEELFSVQVQLLQRYHVTDPRKFYSGDDVWQVPIETYGRERVPVKPYHITAQVQGNEASEFLLLQPLTPLARPNLNAWLAARNDNEHYGELLLIDFPRDSPILGPEQVQALINQEPDISQQFGLWDRGGSEVLQGNLLVVPVGDTLLYVEPVYLKASKGGLPSLARIVVSDGRVIAMAGSLDGAIQQLIQKVPSIAQGTSTGLD